MKRAKIYILWILGIAVWLFIVLFFWSVDVSIQSHTHQLIIIVTGICLALYIWKNKSNQKNALEKENQELKAEIKTLKKKLEEADK